MGELTREDLIRALTVCASEDCYSYDRANCPLYDTDRCLDVMKRQAAARIEADGDRIRELEEQLQIFRAENQRLHRENFWLTGHRDEK